MNVFHFAAGNLYGGVETFLVTLARLRHLVPEMNPAFGVCFRGRFWDELAATGVPLFDLSPVRVSRPWTVMRARRRAAEALTATGADVAVVHSGWGHVVFAPTVRRHGARLVFYAHGPFDGRSWFDRWSRRTPPDKVIANSKFTAASVPAGFPGVPTEICYPPVEPPNVGDPAIVRAEVRAELGTPADAVVILQASRMEAWKGPHVLIEALGLMRDDPGWIGWMAGGPQKAGENAYYDRLRARAKELGVADRIRFLGQRSDVPRLMAAADVFCQPNTGPEPFGIVFVEAMYAGLPVVTSAIGGAVEVVGEGCGMLVPPGRAERLAAELRKLVCDKFHRADRGSGGERRAAELCAPARHMLRVMEVLREDVRS